MKALQAAFAQSDPKITFRRSETNPLASTSMHEGAHDDCDDDHDPSSSGRVKQMTATTMAMSTSETMEEHQGEHHHVSRLSGGNGWGRGIVADIKRTLGTHWKEEMTNMNGKTLAVSFFLYFACIAPAIVSALWKLRYILEYNLSTYLSFAHDLFLVSSQNCYPQCM